jgi:hypothetical protein
MILLETFCKDSTILMIRKSKTLLFAISIPLDKVLLLEISTDFMSTISTKKEDNGKKLFAKTLRIIIQSLLSAGKTMEVDLLQETFAVLSTFMTQVSKKKRKESSCSIMFRLVKLLSKFKEVEKKVSSRAIMDMKSTKLISIMIGMQLVILTKL